MRQTEDASYRTLFSRIHVGLLTESDIKILESRKIFLKGDCFESRLNELCNFINELPSDIVCLLPTCHMCDVLNAAMLNRITSKEIILTAEDTIDCIPYVKEKVSKVLSNNDDDNSKTAGLSKQIAIKIGAKVMLDVILMLVWVLVNGTIATVTSIIQDISTGYVEKIKLYMSSGFEYFIERVSVKFEVMDRAYVIRKQFPLSLSYGIIVYKSQGLSLRNAVMDIGNSVFSCGQVYVALSRVTSLEGLHLINFDPSCVTTDEEAISEYNRLKHKYKPETEMIRISKERYYKMKDVPWTLRKGIISVQESDQKVWQSSPWVIRGFQNIDKVSSYANAVLQCVTNLDIIRKHLSNSNELNALNMLVHQYESGMLNMNTYAVRQYLGEYFSADIERDECDFFTAFCAKHDIRNLIEHQMTCTSRCKSCGDTKVTTDNNVLLSISIITLKKKLQS